MRYDVSILEIWFVLLLINSKGSRIGNNCEKGEKVEEEVEKSCVIVIVNRDRREREIDCFDREAIFAYDIGFFGVVGEVVDVEKTADFIEVDESEEFDVWDSVTDDTSVEGVDEDKTNGVSGVNEVAVSFLNFVCFSRTWL